MSEQPPTAEKDVPTPCGYGTATCRKFGGCDAGCSPLPSAEKDGAEIGTCDLCGQEMIRTADDCWHPYDVERACPTEPADPKMSTRESFDAWQAFYGSGLRPGRPGREHFVTGVLPPGGGRA